MRHIKTEEDKTYYLYSMTDDLDYYGLTKAELDELLEKHKDVKDLEYDIEESMYEILGGDGVNPVYGAEGIWWYPDGSADER